MSISPETAASVKFRDLWLTDAARLKLATAAAEGIDAETTIGLEARRVAARMRQLSGQGFLGRLFDRAADRSRLHRHYRPAILALSDIRSEQIELNSGSAVMDSFTLAAPLQPEPLQDKVTIIRRIEGVGADTVPQEMALWNVETRTNRTGDLRGIEVVNYEDYMPDSKVWGYEAEQGQQIALGVLLGAKTALGIK